MIKETPLKTFFFFQGSSLVNRQVQKAKEPRNFSSVFISQTYFYQGLSDQSLCFKWLHCVFWPLFTPADLHSWLIGHFYVYDFSFFLPSVAPGGQGAGPIKIAQQEQVEEAMLVQQVGFVQHVGFVCFFVLLCLKNKWTSKVEEYWGAKYCYWFLNSCNLELDFLID